MNMISTTSSTRKLTSAAVGIPPRLLDFNFAGKSKSYFYADNAFATLFFAVLSGFFPPGERFFVDSVRHFRDQIDDPVLEAQVSGFIGQEAIHGREHDRMNAMFTDQGIAVSAADRSVKAGLALLKLLPPSQQLACTIFMEHFTAILGEELLSNKNFRRDADPEMLKIWTWHALEELEHKSVAFDVFNKVSGSYRERLLAGPLTVIALAPALVTSMLALLAKDKQLLSTTENARGANILFGKRGFFAHVPRRMTDFYRRSFHPTDDNTKALENEWRERLFGEHGTLLAEFKNKDKLIASAALV